MECPLRAQCERHAALTPSSCSRSSICPKRRLKLSLCWLVCLAASLVGFVGEPVASIRAPVVLRGRREFASIGALALTVASNLACCETVWAAAPRQVQRSQSEWAKMLSPLQYDILRNGGTELPGSSPLLVERRAGIFICAGCKALVFSHKDKFDSGTGWPSFAAPVSASQGGSVVYGVELGSEALGGQDVMCRRCGGHLGDVTSDGVLFPGSRAFETGKRYCIDGAALEFIPDDDSENVLGEGTSNFSLEWAWSMRIWALPFVAVGGQNLVRRLSR